jgi:hypothetical protein
MRIAADERDLVERFDALTYPPNSFDHAEHVRLAWTILAERPLLEGLCEFRRLLQAYVAHHGAAAKYSETITCFYLLFIRERMDQLGAHHDWHEFRGANSDLFGPLKEFLEPWYPSGAAFTAEAQGAFRMPTGLGDHKSNEWDPNR